MKQKLIDIIDDFRQQDAPNDNRNWTEHFADHLIKNGVIVPKLNIGQTIYYIDPSMPKCLIIVEKLEVFKICTQINKYSNIDQTYVCVTESRSLRFIKNEEVNKNAFCSKEEAEEALTKRKE